MELHVIYESLSQDALNQALAGSYWRVSVKDEVTSTQELIRTSNPAHGDVIVAEYQSAGRGRLDRSFEAAKGKALLFSLYIEPKCEKERWSFLPLLVGYTIAQVLNGKTAGTKFFTKWQNDILNHDLKVSGTLVELAGTGVIIGIGVNTHLEKSELPVPTATSIALATEENISRNSLLIELLSALSKNLADWEGGADFVAKYLTSSSTVGREVLATLPGGVEERGVAQGIEPSGALLLSSGVQIEVGDVLHLR